MQLVILGAGFASVQCTRELARKLPWHQDGCSTLVDRHNHLLFMPMLAEVAGGQVDTRHIVAAIRRMSSRITLWRAASTTWICNSGESR